MHPTILYEKWQPLSVKEVCDLFDGAPFQWAVAGGGHGYILCSVQPLPQCNRSENFARATKGQIMGWSNVQRMLNRLFLRSPQLYELLNSGILLLRLPFACGD